MDTVIDFTIGHSEDGSPNGQVTLYVNNGSTIRHDVVSLQAFASFCGKGLEAVEVAKANSDPS